MGEEQIWSMPATALLAGYERAELSPVDVLEARRAELMARLEPIEA